MCVSARVSQRKLGLRCSMDSLSTAVRKFAEMMESRLKGTDWSGVPSEDLRVAMEKNIEKLLDGLVDGNASMEDAADAANYIMFLVLNQDGTDAERTLVEDSDAPDEDDASDEDDDE